MSWFTACPIVLVASLSLICLQSPAGALQIQPYDASRRDATHTWGYVRQRNMPYFGGARGLALNEAYAVVVDSGKQAPLRPLTESTHESWFERMQNAFASVLVGWLLIVFSIPVLWFNEQRTAKMECLISQGESQCRTISGRASTVDNRSCLVHIEGEEMLSAAQVKDQQFNVAFDTDCVRLRTKVEVYQYVESEQTQQRERAGGGRDTEKTYSYNLRWESSWHDSSNFHDRRYKDTNIRPAGLQLGEFFKNCSRVEYGGGFLLNDGLVSQCAGFHPAANRLGDAVMLEKGNIKFQKDEKLGHPGFFVNRRRASGNGDEVGDARVSFEYVPNGSATVMALQTDGKDSNRDTFLPYRLVPRGLCGISEDQEKRLLDAAGRKSPAELAEDAACTGFLAICCCACNAVNTCFASLLTPEIYHLFQGSMTADACFRLIKSRLSMSKWLLRFVGWLMMFFGLYMTFEPITTFITVIPFLGPILASFGSFLIYVFSFLVTAVVAVVIIVTAYLAYRPLWAFQIALFASAIIAVVLAIASRL